MFEKELRIILITLFGMSVTISAFRLKLTLPEIHERLTHLYVYLWEWRLIFAFGHARTLFFERILLIIIMFCFNSKALYYNFSFADGSSRETTICVMYFVSHSYITNFPYWETNVVFLAWKFSFVCIKKFESSCITLLSLAARISD